MKVAIVCGSPSSEFLAPYGDESFEIWVLGNRAQRHLDKRISRIFEIHNHIDQPDPEAYKNWLVSLNIPLVVGECEWPDGVERFDYAESARLFGSLYLTSSPAYMISYAISQGAEEIHIYGVDLAISDHEYFWQRPCVEAWIGFAKGLGIKVYVPEVSNVGKCSYIEGRDWNGSKKADGPFSVSEFEAMAAEHVKSRDAIAQQQRALELKEAAHYGAQQAYERLAKVARATDAKIDIKTLSETTVII